MSNKQESLNDVVKDFARIEHKYYNMIFDQKIKPILKRYNWIIFWSMGGIGFVNQKGEDLDNKTINALFKTIGDMKLYPSECSGLWDTMVHIKPNDDTNSWGSKSNYPSNAYNPQLEDK